jgi:hypothetical protein
LFITIKRCPVCNSDQLRAVLEIPRMPVHCTVLWRDEISARNAPTGDMALRFCKSCGHSFNAAFRPELVEYAEGYENSLYFSPTFREYADQLARKLVSSFHLHGKELIEIGSGGGDFLKALCTLGGNRGTGFDPSAQPDSPSDQVNFIRDLYTDQYSHTKADFLVCRHVLEHLVAPRELLQVVQSALRDAGSGVYFEVPNASFLFAGGSIWDLIYAHVSYYSRSSLGTLFARNGFKPVRCSSEFGDQFLGIEAVPGAAASDSGFAGGDLQEVSASVAAFAETYTATVSFWRSELEREAAAGHCVVVWGAGAKAVSFLNAAPEAGQIGFAVDLNPRKQGAFLPGSGAEIIAPQRLLELRPDLVIILNPIYEGEIRRDLDAMGLSKTRSRAVHACQALPV